MVLAALKRTFFAMDCVVLRRNGGSGHAALAKWEFDPPGTRDCPLGQSHFGAPQKRIFLHVFHSHAPDGAFLPGFLPPSLSVTEPTRMDPGRQGLTTKRQSTGGRRKDMLRIHVAIATVGRAGLARQTIDLLGGQSRQPDGVLVVGASEADLEGLGHSALQPELALAERGLCRQRNRALDLLDGRTDVVIFFDDDFVPSPDYLASVERLFLAHPDIAGITGNLVGDGVRHGGYGIAQAQAMIAAQTLLLDPAIIPREALYGCNMALRMAHVGSLRFDEALPLYGWQEDIDFTMRLSRRGRLVSTGLVSGVHLGVKGGRTSGRRLGYSQVANIVYLRRKGTMPVALGRKLLWRNVAANLLLALFPEPHVDRLGRLRGNLLAFLDLVRGQIDPRKIESM